MANRLLVIMAWIFISASMGAIWGVAVHCAFHNVVLTLTLMCGVTIVAFVLGCMVVVGDISNE